jgi:hypothetical protein
VTCLPFASVRVLGVPESRVEAVGVPEGSRSGIQVLAQEPEQTEVGLSVVR